MKVKIESKIEEIIEEIIVPIFNNEYKVIVCFGKPERAQKILYKWGYKNDLVIEAKGNRGLCYHEGRLHPFIYMPHRPKPDEVGILAHESIHAIAHIFRLISQSQGSAEEVFAHSVEAIIRTVLIPDCSKL